MNNQIIKVKSLSKQHIVDPMSNQLQYLSINYQKSLTGFSQNDQKAPYAQKQYLAPVFDSQMCKEETLQMCQQSQKKYHQLMLVIKDANVLPKIKFLQNKLTVIYQFLSNHPPCIITVKEHTVNLLVNLGKYHPLQFRIDPQLKFRLESFKGVKSGTYKLSLSQFILILMENLIQANEKLGDIKTQIDKLKPSFYDKDLKRRCEWILTLYKRCQQTHNNLKQQLTKLYKLYLQYQDYLENLTIQSMDAYYQGSQQHQQMHVRSFSLIRTILQIFQTKFQFQKLSLNKFIQFLLEVLKEFLREKQINI